MSATARTKNRTLAALVGALVLAGCAKPPPPAPPPPPLPPPPVVHVDPIPYRPLPPAGASYAMYIPPVGASGARTTIDSGLDADETVWHLRSAWNVAALNCLGEAYEPILEGYKGFLKKYKTGLTAANAAIDKKYRLANGASLAATKARQAHMTQVYNYFAVPAVLPDMCQAMMAVAADAAQAPPKQDLKAFAAANLPRIEATYLKFFDAYDRYRAASADWDAKYGIQYGASQPGYVAVHGAGQQPSVASGLIGTSTPGLAGTVADPETGAQIPIVKQPDPTISVPLIQPVQQDKK